MLKDTERMMHDRGKKVSFATITILMRSDYSKAFAVYCYESAKFDASRRNSISE